MPSIREVFSKVRKEENMKKVMLGESPTIPTINNASALAARGVQNTSNDNRPKKGRPWRDHCRKPGHTRETCCRIHGKPVDWKLSRPAHDKETRGHHVVVEEGNHVSTEFGPFNKEQLEALQKMFSQQTSTQSTIGT